MLELGKAGLGNSVGVLCTWHTLVGMVRKGGERPGGDPGQLLRGARGTGWRRAQRGGMREPSKHWKGRGQASVAHTPYTRRDRERGKASRGGVWGAEETAGACP